MANLTRFTLLDEQLDALLPPVGSIENQLDRTLAQLFPGLTLTARGLNFGNHNLLDLVGAHLLDGGNFRVPAGTRPAHADAPLLNLPERFNEHIAGFCQTLRQGYHARLASYWQERDARGLSRQVRLEVWYRDQLAAQVRLRRADQTLSAEHGRLLHTCMELPSPWQRRHLPLAERPQVYRLLLSTASPHWRRHLPGYMVLTETGPEGRALEHHEAVGRVLLCSHAHGLEPFDSLAQMHTELCERLEDPAQGEHLVKWLVEPADQLRARQAERLRYDWYVDDVVEAQVASIRDTQGKRLSQAWHLAWKTGKQRHITQLDAALTRALDMRQAVNSRGLLATRYGLLLEKHLPNWLRSTPRQGVAHIMQALQEQVAAVQAASAPGILTLEQFNQRHSLQAWVRERLREFLQRDPGLDTDPADIRISVTLARQTGPIVNPLPTGGTASYIPIVSRPQVGDSIELVRHTYRLEDLALLNIAWFDVDYWLTARVHLSDNSPLPALTPLRVKEIVRRLNAGSGYQAYLRTQLLESPEGRWRQAAHAQLNRTRMNAEAVKARYAGHFLAKPHEQGYSWASTVIHGPDSQSRTPHNGQPVIVKQILVQSHTVEGVLLLVSPAHSRRIVAYCPDAPDRRYWREYENARALIRAVRSDERLRAYIIQRLPLLAEASLTALLLKGRLGSHIKLQTIEGNLYEAVYRAEVHSLMAHTDKVTRDNHELLGEFSVNVLRLLLDMVTLVLPLPGQIALAFGRMGISLWDGFEAFDEDDHASALHHAIAALGHATSGLNEMAGSGLMRRVMRGLPKPPPVPLPAHYEAAPDVARLRYRIDAAHGEAVYERSSVSPGLSRYFVRDNQNRFYDVSFDGTRWRATDPDQPYAYLKLPVKRRDDGSWVVDSPVLWYDGLPDVRHLLDACRPVSPLAGDAVADEADLFQDNATLYLQLQAQQLPVRRHLLASHYHLIIPDAIAGAAAAWAVLRRQDGEWRIRLRQTGRGSDWLALPADYSPSLGSSLSRR
ncbi:dermonecrotic toxin domain-containing protein [Pseudomonas sp. NPDC089408]|uniref:dermonecrotic toxin domain-containing protein n=1 Tax=Pseudomonas sp. NPDC089408 TaxID=3364465 RepID=UPI00382F0CC0